MIRFRRHLLEMVAGWDTPTRSGVAIAVALLFAALLLFQFGGETWQTPAIVGVTTLLVVIEVLVLWGNRRMVTPFTQAQRHYLAGEFDAVVQLLAVRAASDDVDVSELTLLGNTYRQQGNLSESEEILSKAVNISPDSYFPLYGFGRTLLVKGQYSEAAKALHQSLERGAPPVVHLDLAEVYHHLGEVAHMRGQVAHAPENLEPYRALMRAYLLQQPPAPELADGLPYWEQTQSRFARTRYGQDLTDIVQWMQTHTQGGD